MPYLVTSVSNENILTATKLGRECYWRDMPLSANPYGGTLETNPDYNPTLSGAWVNGWKAAESEEEEPR